MWPIRQRASTAPQVGCPGAVADALDRSFTPDAVPLARDGDERGMPIAIVNVSECRAEPIATRFSIPTRCRCRCRSRC